MPGKVIEGHAKLESACTNCHVRFNRAAQPQLCLGCHKEVAADVRSRSGYHGRLADTECRSCHTDHQGREAKIVVLDERDLDHSRTDFQLVGKHRGTPCVDCHRLRTKHRAAPSECAGCHRKDDRHKGNLGPRCETCHDATDWKAARFDHGRTRVPLLRRHAQVKCADCHAEERYADTPRDCVACHKKHDAHKGHFGPRCEACHTEGGWKASTFLHGRDTRFPLRDRHQTVKCERCHKSPLYREPTPKTCRGCHGKDDVHRRALGDACEKCHTEKSWKGTHFDHDRDSRFPVRDGHRRVKCEGCHRNTEYRDKPPLACVGCHELDDREKGHRGRYGGTCATCHTEKAWKALAFDHDRDSRYPLRDSHRRVKCEGCHQDTGFLARLPSACSGCHERDDREKAHRGRYGERCAICHTEKGWKALVFEHDRDTRYPVRGKHRQVKCDACHRGSLYREKTDPRCIACHQPEDRHKGQLGAGCEACHDERDWRETRFDHNRSRYPLLESHTRVPCKECHPTLLYKDTKTECVSCHAKADRHRERLGPRCEQCHKTRSWKIWEFDHQRTRLPLDGLHVKVACLACHTAPVKDTFDLASTCFTCHRKDDAHLGSLGRQCDRCHVADHWRRIVKRERIE